MGEGEGVDDELVAALWLIGIGIGRWLIVGPWRCVGGTDRVADRQCLRALVTRARLYLSWTEVAKRSERRTKYNEFIAKQDKRTLHWQP